MRYQFFKYNESEELVPFDGPAYIDGYPFGERLLDGVMFKVSIVGDDIKIDIAEGSKDYFEDLNKKKWLKAAKKEALDTDQFSENENGDGDVVLYDHSKPYNEQSNVYKKHPVTGDSSLTPRQFPGIAIPVTSGDDIMSFLSKFIK